MEKLRIVVAEEHVVLKAIMVTLLNSEFQVIAEVDDGEQLVQAVISCAPNVIVSDISTARLNGVGARRQLLSYGIAIPFVFVTSGTADLYSLQNPKAVGWVHKVDLVDELNTAVSVVVSGYPYVSKSLDSQV